MLIPSVASAHSGYGPEPSARDTDRLWDVCVIGSGASGAAVAATLRRAGLDVLILERGGYVGEETSYDDLLAAAEPAWVRQDNGTWACLGYPWTTCNVGGGTVFYGGVTFRHRSIDFDASALLGASEMPVAWPWTPTELSPYYDAIERIVGVSGAADADPGMPRDHPYPMDPVPISRAGVLIRDAAMRLGLHPFPTPLAIATRPYGGRPACDAVSECISHRCETGAKGDAFSVFLAPLLNAGGDGLRVLAGLRVDRLIRSGGSEVTAAACVREHSGREYRFRASHFVVACNAVQSAALLLRSADADAPSGLGNQNDVVGRGLCFKLSEYLVGFIRQQVTDTDRPHRSGIGPCSTISILDHYVAEDAPGGLGGLIYEAAPEQALHLGAGEQVLRLECIVPDEPRWQNRVRLDHRSGPPQVVMDYQPHPRDLARLEYLLRRGERILHEAGCSIVLREPSGWALGSGHLHGTARAGRDPATSATDPDGRLHGVPNVVVVDGALLPFPGAVNPTHTIQAVALRCTVRLLRSAFGIEINPADLGPSMVGGA
jgi:choline dehydrogenase-like flavoprotein